MLLVFYPNMFQQKEIPNAFFYRLKWSREMEGSRQGKISLYSYWGHYCMKPKAFASGHVHGVRDGYANLTRAFVVPLEIFSHYFSIVKLSSTCLYIRRPL